MTGAWRVFARGQRWPRSPRSVWLVVEQDRQVVQFNGPVLELLTATRMRTDPRIVSLGPDVVAGQPFDEAKFLRRLREDDPTRELGDALLDQHIVAGIGNFWKSEGCWLAGVDPWRRIVDVEDQEALAVIRAVRPLYAAVGRARATGPVPHDLRQGRAPVPALRRPRADQARGQGDDNRTTYWCAALPELIVRRRSGPGGIVRRRSGPGRAIVAQPFSVIAWGRLTVAQGSGRERKTA